MLLTKERVRHDRVARAAAARAKRGLVTAAAEVRAKGGLGVAPGVRAREGGTRRVGADKVRGARDLRLHLGRLELGSLVNTGVLLQALDSVFGLSTAWCDVGLLRLLDECFVSTLRVWRSV